MTAPKPALGAILNPSRRTSWTATDLLVATFPTPRWAIPDIVPEGLSLLVGPPKLGKSWLALNMALAVAAGGRALGRIPVEQGEVLYLALEDPPRRLQSRLLVALEEQPAPEGLHLETAWPAMHDGGGDHLDTWLSEHVDTRLVVVDVLAKVRGTTSAQEDRYTADYRSLSALKDLADKHRVALVVIHHTRKAQSEDFLDSVSGTNGIAGAADTVLVLGRSRGSVDAALNMTGRDVEERKLALNLTGGRWTLLDGVAEDYELGDTRRRLLHLVREDGPRTPKQAADTLGINYELAKKTLQRMASDGEVANSRGSYSCTPVPPVPLSPVFDLDEGHGDMGDTPTETFEEPYRSQEETP